MKKHLLLLFAALLPLVASAQTKVETDGIWYNLNAETREAEVTFKGDRYNSYDEYSGAITIPAVVTNNGEAYSVTSIGYGAFYGCSSLTAITLPEGVTSIGAYAFFGCSSLTAITLPEGVTSIGEYAFSWCTSLTSITLPEGVTSIGDYAFYICSSLTSITIPEGVTSIGEYAFSWCSSLTSLTITENVTSIGNHAFLQCSRLTSINIPENSQLTSIGDYAFNGCSSLTSITIPEGVTSIGESAFASCPELTDVYCYAESVPSTETDVFDGSYQYVTLHVPASSLEAYKTTAPWDKFGKYEVIMFAANAQQLQTGDTFTYTDIDGVEKTYKVVGENLIENPSFDNGTTGWTGGGGGTLNNTEVNYSGGVDGGAYIRPTVVAGKSSDSSIGTAWDVEVGKTYVFSFFLKNQTNTAAESPAGGGYIKVSMSDTYRDETLVLRPLPHVDAGLAWTQNTWVVTAEYSSLALCARWLGGAMCFDAFILAEVEEVGDNKDLEDLLVASITLSQSSATLTEGETLTLTATVSPDDAEDKSISWSSNNPSVATVDNMGKVTAIAPGTTTITVTANDGSGVSAQCEVTVTPASYVITYLIDGEQFFVETLTRGSAITLPEVPAKEGYTFSGWGEVPETMPAKDVTISGTFIANKYLVTFKIDDEVIIADSLEYGTAIVAPEAPEKEGYTFSGWGEVAGNVPAHDLTYEGSYSINSYTLTYVVDGEAVLTLPIVYGATIPSLKAPAKEGYKFSGWSEAPAVMPAKDVTIEGTFTQLPSIYLTINQADNGCVKQHLVVGTVCAYTIEAAEGWKIHSVTFNGEDVTSQLTEEGTFTTPALQEDATLNIAYEKIDDAISHAQASRIKVQGHQGVISIAGATEGAAIGLYTTEGTLVATATAEGDTTQLTVPTGQVYIVKVADTVVKIGM